MGSRGRREEKGAKSGRKRGEKREEGRNKGEEKRDERIEMKEEKRVDAGKRDDLRRQTQFYISLRTKNHDYNNVPNFSIHKHNSEPIFTGPTNNKNLIAEFNSRIGKCYTPSGPRKVYLKPRDDEVRLTTNPP